MFRGEDVVIVCGTEEARRELRGGKEVVMVMVGESKKKKVMMSEIGRGCKY